MIKILEELVDRMPKVWLLLSKFKEIKLEECKKKKRKINSLFNFSKNV